LWFLKQNNRRINITGITAGTTTTIDTTEAHILEVGMYAAVSNAVGMVEINDVATGTWVVGEVLSVPTATSVELNINSSAFTAYTSGGTLHRVMGFTDNVGDLIRDGLLYNSKTAFSPTAYNVTDKLQVPTVEMESIMLPSPENYGISEEDINGGMLDFAEVRVQIVNYEDLSLGGLWVARGYVGQITVKNDQYVAELRGLSQIAAQNILELYSAGCRFDLGSRRCQKDVSVGPFFVTGSITSITTDRVKFVDTVRTEATGYFDYGKITFRTGNNAGIGMEVRTYTNGDTSIELWQPMPFTFTVGDTYELVAGCDKTLETCRDKFDNLINHGGFPHLPGEDELAKVLVPKPPNVTTSD
jgi:uncharacterized phage protein (TIGR02218 family)